MTLYDFKHIFYTIGQKISPSQNCYFFCKLFFPALAVK